VQECFTNTLKHFTADVLVLEVNKAERVIAVNMSDNGKLIKHFNMGNGLKSMAERLSLIGGHVHFTHDNKSFSLQYRYHRKPYDQCHVSR
jgi:signal transduction histidine kinase